MKLSILNMTPKLRHTLEFIMRFVAAESFSPTLKDIAVNFNISRTSANERLDRLKHKKLITRKKNTARGISLTDRGRFYLANTPSTGMFTEHEKTAIRYKQLLEQDDKAHAMLTERGIPAFAEIDGEITGNSINARLEMYLIRQMTNPTNPL